MDNNCQLVVFSDKAYNAIIRETFEWDPVETGGILLGHILDNGCWIVMEVLPPGYGEGREGDNVYHEYSYFEYNQKFVNYLAKSVSEQYEIPLELLGLWHRHPGSMDHFSGTDDGTNSTFAAQNPNGAISGLVNVDPQLRMTMYYLSHEEGLKRNGRLNYQTVQVEVGSDLIPEDYFKLRHYRGDEKDLHPYAPQRKQHHSKHVFDNLVVDNTEKPGANTEGEQTLDSKSIIEEQLRRNRNGYEFTAPERPYPVKDSFFETVKRNKTFIILILAIIGFVVSIFAVKSNISDLFKSKKEQGTECSHKGCHKKESSKQLDKGDDAPNNNDTTKK